MDVILRRNRLDAQEARVLQATRQDEMADQISPANGQGRERHPDLKSNPSLFRQHRDRAEPPKQSEKCPKEFAHTGILPVEMGIQPVLAAEVRLVAIRETPATFRTAPQAPASNYRRVAHVVRPPPGNISLVRPHGIVSSSAEGAKFEARPPTVGDGYLHPIEHITRPHILQWSTCFDRFRIHKRLESFLSNVTYRRINSHAKPACSSMLDDEWRAEKVGDLWRRSRPAGTISMIFLIESFRNPVSNEARENQAERQGVQRMIGKTVGNYRITAKLGAGGMGEVFLAEDIRLDRKAAIKFLPAELANDSERRQRFLTEAKAASALNHPHVCVVYDVGETVDGLPFIAMEFVEGQSLDALVRQGPLGISRVAEIAVQVADALDAAHNRRIVHRDIKPANISLNERGQVKVLDFGIAKRMPTLAHRHDVTQEMQKTQQGQVLGTPSYMSPEQALGKDLDHRSDIFSVGVVIYELATGQRPFTGSNFSEIVNNVVHAQPPAIARLNYNVPPELERITLKCLQKQPDRRYQSARELMVDLRNLVRELENGGADAVMRSGVEFTQTCAGNPGGFSAEPFSLEKLKKSDVLLNYAMIDDQPLFDGRPGWVSQLHRNLEVRIEQLSGEKVSISRLPGSAVSAVVEGQLLEHLPHAKAMISVVSPPFIKSDICRKEVERFWRGAEESGGAWVNDKARLLKVLKTAVSAEEIPPALADIFSPLFGFEFFELDSETGRLREFDETFGPLLKQRFFERVYDLAYDTCQVLRMFQQVRAGGAASMEPDPSRRWIYLATTTSDVQDERDRIRRELLERGHLVLPDAPLPTLSRDVEATVRQCVGKCTIAIHLLGRRYGVTPEDSAESIQALQIRLTAEQTQRPELQRLIWLTGDGQIADERQQAFILRVQEDPALHHRAEIIEGNLNLLKKDLIRRLSPPEEKPKEAAPSTAAGGPPKLYLICDAKDEPKVEALEDYLFDQGLEVSLPGFDGADADAAALHQDNLRTCDAALVYYATAPKAWVEIKLRELLKAAGYERERPITVQAVYIAPPYDHRKDRFRSHQASVIRQTDEFAPSTELDAFVKQIKEACV
jgi:serine/threonine protein kinase